MTAVVGDNTAACEHRSGYNGLWSLTSVREARTVFVPSYAGLNLEHIFDGRFLSTAEERFEPRYHPMELVDVTAGSATLHQPPTFHSRLESWTTFRMIPPCGIDMDFRCIPMEKVFAGNFIGLFWASYINGPLDKSLYFPREAKPDGSVIWQQLCTQWHDRDSTVLHRDDRTELSFHPQEKALYTAFSRVRFALPFYYGRFGDMVLIYLFDRTGGIRFSHSPSGGGMAAAGDDSNPAWDFQFLIQPYEAGQTYSFRLRTVYKPWAGRADVLAEYRQFVTR
ncbi:MAG: hypothetical protein HYU36_20115 [Planctomycetes bacterium]|nr:hypothetical protein [Planctomycetota bacterium]